MVVETPAVSQAPPVVFSCLFLVLFYFYFGLYPHHRHWPSKSFHTAPSLPSNNREYLWMGLLLKKTRVAGRGPGQAEEKLNSGWMDWGAGWFSNNTGRTVTLWRLARSSIPNSTIVPEGVSIHRQDQTIESDETLHSHSNSSVHSTTYTTRGCFYCYRSL